MNTSNDVLNANIILIWVQCDNEILIEVSSNIKGCYLIDNVEC